LLASGHLAAGRLAALYALAGQNALKSDGLLKALSDADAHMREKAVLFCEPLLHGADCPPAIWSRLQKMAADPAITVRYQLAFALGESKLAEKVDALAEIAKHDIADPGIRAAILSSLAGNESLMFAKLAEIAEIKRDIAGQQFLADLARLVALAHKPEEIDQVTRVIKAEDSRGNLQSAFALTDALENGAQSVPATDRPKLDFAQLMKRAVSLAASDTSDPPTRIAAIRMLAHDTEPTTFDSLIDLIKPSESQEIQLATISSLDRLGGAQLARKLLERWPTLSPRLRSDVLSVLLKRPDRAKALLDAIQKGTLRTSDLSTSQSAFLRRHRDKSVRELAGKVLVPSSRGREEVVQAFMPALGLKGDAAKGRLIYEQRCISCHRLGGEGSAVGPDLVTVRNSGKEKALINILDPSREVAPNFVAYQVETRSGESLVGILASETATSVTIRQAFGKDTTVLRTDVRRLESQKMSLMPEGFEQGLTTQDFANLLEFIMTAPAQLPPGQTH
jgi:putative heme-binding domain-containing protein